MRGLAFATLILGTCLIQDIDAGARLATIRCFVFIVAIVVILVGA
jgi:hypothetical protein